jgi:predicted Zn finger-like uncharacterized protein
MNVSCPECASVFRVDPQKVPAGGVRARCAVCGGVFEVAGGPDVPTPRGAIGEADVPHATDRGGEPDVARAPEPSTEQDSAPPPPEPRRPFNPYLSNEPGQKARRLARALVSDLVAYHPQKREEGLRTGTLKQLFRDDIRKSWDEYVEQVGQPLAESTTHFQDALNDVLAGGRKIF